MARMLTKLRIAEVSGVDRGAGEGVKVMLMKRDAPLSADAEAYLKREFSEDDRKRLADAGTAMKDGSYPIENKADLANAVQAFGRAKDKPAARKHIIARARALGAVDALPETWKVEKRGMLVAILEKIGLKKQATDFETAQANTEAAEYAQGMIEEFNEAIDSLQQSICSIMCDQDCADKQAAIDETIKQFQQHVQGVVPEGIEQAMRGAALAAAGFSLTDQGTIQKGAAIMTDDEKKKLEQDKAAANDGREKAEKALTLAKREIAVLKMSDKHKSYVAARGDTMKQDEKDKFADMEPAERDDHMDKHPVADDVEKRIAAEVAKRVATDPAIIDLQKRNTALEQAAQLATFTKQAVDQGLGEAHGVTLQKAYAGDKASIDTLLTLTKGAIEQARVGGVFKEFGASTTTGADASAHAALTAKAAELRKADPKLSEAQAYAKAYQDPANVDLAKRERAENRPA